jgi:hypothetical protein
MPERRMEKKEVDEDFDPLLDKPPRRLYFSDEADTKDRSEKVKEEIDQAGKDTRNANQYVKLVNAHLQRKMTALEKIKQAQKKFEQEVDMFKMDAGETEQNQPVMNQPDDVETVLIIRELSTMINKYGVEKISKALDQLFANR